VAKLLDILKQAHKDAASATGRLSVLITKYDGKVPERSSDMRALADAFQASADYMTRVADAIDKVNAR
jgi:hypothetical protein